MKTKMMLFGLAAMMATATTLPANVQAETSAAKIQGKAHAESAPIKGQPNMQAALAALKEARVSLKKAKANKGGHRGAALKLVEQVIAEVEAGAAHAKAKNRAKKAKKKARDAKRKARNSR